MSNETEIDTTNGHLGEKDGVSIEKTADGFLVSFPFDRQLAKIIRGLPDANYEKELKAFSIPMSSTPELGKVATALRAESRAIHDDMLSIKALAMESGFKAQRQNGGVLSGVSPKVSEYHEPAKLYSGEVLNANGRYIALFSGFGKDNGAAFLSIHRVADLDRQKIMKGEHVGIVYNEKFLGVVTDLAKYKTDAQLEAECQATIGKTVDGVTVTDRGDHIGVSFEMNPALVGRIRRLEGAVFNVEEKIWEIPMDKREYALRAVHDMRNEFVLDEQDAEMMRGLAESKIDGAKVSKAFTKNGQEHYGKVVAVSDRYALQKAGGDKFTLHHLAALDQFPKVDQNLSIKYQKGLGTVVDQDLQRAQNKALGR